MPEIDKISLNQAAKHQFVEHPFVREGNRIVTGTGRIDDIATEHGMNDPEDWGKFMGMGGNRINVYSDDQAGIKPSKKARQKTISVFRSKAPRGIQVQ